MQLRASTEHHARPERDAHGELSRGDRSRPLQGVLLVTVPVRDVVEEVDGRGEATEDDERGRGRAERRPDQRYGDLIVIESNANAYYDAFVASMDKRLSNGLTFRVNYAFAVPPLHKHPPA